MPGKGLAVDDLLGMAGVVFSTVLGDVTYPDSYSSAVTPCLLGGVEGGVLGCSLSSSIDK